MSNQFPAHNRNESDLVAIARLGDLVMFITLLASAAAALAIGDYYTDLQLALGASAVLILFGGMAYFTARGTLMSRSILTVCNVGLVVLHIQLGRGTVEFHFGVFVLLGLLLVYRDWRMLILAAGLFVVQHVSFDRLQALNVGVYCTAEPNFLKTLMHVCYVVGQTLTEVYLAIRLRQAAIESSDLLAIVRRVDRDGLIRLDVADLEVSAPTAVRLKAAIMKMESAMSEVSLAAASIENASAEIALGNIYLSQRTEEQASSLQQTAVSMAQLTGSVKDTAQTAEDATELARSASTAAIDGGEAVGRVVSTMREIAQASTRIADISAVVDSIAFQTNILALNAAVEAARAGEQGRGFAVVATEVRSLAQRSAGAAREIKSLIGDSTGRVDVGVELVGAAGVTIENVVRQAQMVSQLIGTISTASGQQTSGITEVNDAVTQLDAVTQQNAALVEQSAAATESLKDQATRLKEVVSRFSLDAGLEHFHVAAS
jgi:methyl-accepting chemotaxis protein